MNYHCDSMYDGYGQKGDHKHCYCCFIDLYWHALLCRVVEKCMYACLEIGTNNLSRTQKGGLGAHKGGSWVHNGGPVPKRTKC